MAEGQDWRTRRFDIERLLGNCDGIFESIFVDTGELARHDKTLRVLAIYFDPQRVSLIEVQARHALRRSWSCASMKDIIKRMLDREHVVIDGPEPEGPSVSILPN